MANILVVNGVIPLPLSNGWNLRVLHLSKSLAEDHSLFLAAFPVNTDQLDALKVHQIYREITLLPAFPGAAQIGRLFRLGQGDYFKTANREHFDDVVARLQRIVDDNDIDLVVTGRLTEAEFVQPLREVVKVVDDFDCQTLTFEREYAVRKSTMTTAERLRYQLQYLRIRNQERRLTRQFDLITTISRADQQRLLELNPVRQDAIKVVPNGVSSDFLASGSEPAPQERAIAFWGNLAFPPNHSAVHYFYREVYLPYLADRDIRWYIIGREADDSINELAARHPDIIVTGFVEDLKSLVARIPVVINPMIMGSGLKNKVLEAFAQGRAVVSTSLGMEAIDAAPGEHYRLADSPDAFAREVLGCLDDPAFRERVGKAALELVRTRYSWEAVGGLWKGLLESVLE